MPLKQSDVSLEAAAEAALKQRQLTKKDHVDTEGVSARFIGVGPLQGVDTFCRILEVTDSRTGEQVNDAVDVGTINIVIGFVGGQQVKVEATEGYFLEIGGVLPPGVPTGEPQPGARGLEHDPHAGVSFPPAFQPFQPGQPALAALAGAGEHGAPVSDKEKKARAREAEASRQHAAKLSQAGAGGALGETSKGK